jgi:hypothetical protein
LKSFCPRRSTSWVRSFRNSNRLTALSKTPFSRGSIYSTNLTLICKTPYLYLNRPTTK